MPAYGFSEADARRIGQVVRSAEHGRIQKIQLAGENNGRATPGVRLMVGNCTNTVAPFETAQFYIASGEELSNSAYTVVFRNSLFPLVDTAATAYVGNNGWGWHVVEGVQQMWCGEIDEPWPIGAERTILLHGPGLEVTAINEVAPIHCLSGAEAVVAYTDDKWRVVNAETYHTRPGSYNASTEWLNGANKVVTFACGDTANVRNDVASVPLWSGTHDCVAAYEYGQWSLVAAETYYVRRGTFSGTWAKGSSKTVSLTIGGSVSADNLFADVNADGGSASCAVAYEDGVWFLIAAECD